MMSHTCDILQDANENGGTFLKNKKKNALQVSILQKCLKKKKKGKITNKIWKCEKTFGYHVFWTLTCTTLYLLTETDTVVHVEREIKN